jgi:16S rRNA processing protein RimM
MTNRLIQLGHIGAAHGIRGEVTIVSYTGDPVAIGGYGPLTDEAGKRRFVIKALRVAGKGLVARLEGVNDRNAAEALRNTGLYIERDHLPATEAEEWYQADLIGLAVIAPDGAPLGRIVAFHDFGAGDLVEIAIDGRRDTVLLPFTDPYIGAVDVAAGTVVAEIPADLLDSRAPPDDGEASSDA